MFACSLGDTLDSGKHTWMISVETLSTACNRYLWLDLPDPLNWPSGVWSVGLLQLLLSFYGQTVTIEAAR